MSHKPGGGLHSKVVKHSSNPKTEPKSYARNPAAIAQYGQHVGDHTTNNPQSTGYKGDPDTMKRGYQNPVGPTSMALSDLGAGRQVMGCGSQGVHGATNPGNAPAKNTDILRQFGPDYRK